MNTSSLRFPWRQPATSHHQVLKTHHGPRQVPRQHWRVPSERHRGAHRFIRQPADHSRVFSPWPSPNHEQPPRYKVTTTRSQLITKSQSTLKSLTSHLYDWRLNKHTAVIESESGHEEDFSCRSSEMLLLIVHRVTLYSASYCNLNTHSKFPSLFTLINAQQPQQRWLWPNFCNKK